METISIPKEFKTYIESISKIEITNLVDAKFDEFCADWDDEEYDDWMDYFQSYYGDGDIHWSETFNHFFWEFMDTIDPHAELEFTTQEKNLCKEYFYNYLEKQ